MAIINGNLADADEVLNAMGLSFSDSANLIWNADLTGFDSDLEQEWNNTTWDTLQDNSMIDETNSDYDSIPIIGGDVLDNFSDNSIDATIWSTSGTVTESGQRLNIGGTSGLHSATADGASAIDFNNEDYRAIIRGKFDAISGGGNASVKIIVVDESANSVNVSPAGLDSSNFQTVRLDFEPGTNNVQVYLNDPTASGAGTAKDVSSLQDGDEWHLKFEAFGQFAGDNSVINLEWVRYVDNSVTNNDFISDAVTSSSTITNAILAKSDELEGSSTISYFLSADNGSNYEAVTPNEIHRFSNTGTQLKVKATLNTTATEIPVLHHYAVKYNFY